MASTNPPGEPPHTVRFKSQNEEIEPERSLGHVETLTSPAQIARNDRHRDDLSPEAQAELRNNLAITLLNSRMQATRMENFAYEPMSLPVSRVPSSEASQTPPRTAGSTPRPSPPVSTVHTPPLTPAGSSNSRDGKVGSTPQSMGRLHPDPVVVTPQVSPPREPPPTSIPTEQPGQRSPQARLPTSKAQASERPRSMVNLPGATPSHPAPVNRFSVGSIGDSLPASREGSPTGTPGISGTSTPYSRPFTPTGEPDNPYARSKRPPQPKNVQSLDPRFIFAGADSRRSSYHGSSSTTSLPRSNRGATDTKSSDEKRLSWRGGINKDIDPKAHLEKPHGSMSDLKRFLKLGGKKHKRSDSPSKSTKSNRSGTRTPPSRNSSISVPFADDHGLESKYGKFGKVLGSGAGGSVRLLKRGGDGTVFAVKQFRARHSYESEREYNKKVTAEFCIGSTLHHGNIIETMDILQEKGNWFEVMEYAPYDLFAIVMTGKMSREEVSCCTLQIVAGVTYLHSMGLAHRDLKLDNVVVNEHGIMKIIDFGSAAVFRYPFENDIVLASGIVGSDPYLAPEVYDLPKYDPQPTDIWSLAIIFCCMTLKRFPWKAPRISDNSYKLFISKPDEESRPRSIAGSPTTSQSEPVSRETSSVSPSSSSTSAPQHRHHHHHHHHDKSDSTSNTTADTSTKAPTTAPPSVSGEQKQQVIKGPWRLLRLLPRETRHIIGRMLEVDPKKRATLDEILQDKWVTQTPVCHQEEGGVVFRAGNHEHTLEPGAGATPAPSRK